MHFYIVSSLVCTEYKHFRGIFFFPTNIEVEYLILYDLSLLRLFSKASVRPLVPNPGSGSTPALRSVFFP